MIVTNITLLILKNKLYNMYLADIVLLLMQIVYAIVFCLGDVYYPQERKLQLKREMPSVEISCCCSNLNYNKVNIVLKKFLENWCWYFKSNRHKMKLLFTMQKW